MDRYGVRCGPTAWTPLLIVATIPPMIEAAVLSQLAIPRAAAFSPQITGMPPFGAFHDLRWVAVFHRSWLEFGLAILGAALFRSILTAAMAHAAGVRPVGGRPLLVMWRRAFVGTVVLFGVFALPTLLLFGSEVVSLSWMVMGGVGSFLVLAVVAHHGPLSPAWWSRLPPARTIGWLLASTLAFTVAGAILETVPAWAIVPVAGLAGVFNAWAWSSIVGALCEPVAAPLRLPVGAIAIGSVVATMAVLTWVGFRISQPAAASEAKPATLTVASPDRHPVIDIRGFSSSYDGRSSIDLGRDYAVQRFSYRGLDVNGQPLPYTSEDTHQSIDASVRALAAQVDTLHASSGQPVRIVASSEGTVIARVLVAMTPPPPVSDLLVLSPLVWPDRVSYPPPGDVGWGFATGYGLRALGWLVTSLSDIQVGADQPFVRSILDHSDALEFGVMCPQPGVRERAIVPVAEAVAGVLPEPQHLPVRVVGGFHGTAISPAEVRDELTAMLHGAEPESSSGVWAWVNRVVGGSAAAWQTPPLSLIDDSSDPEARDPDRCIRAQEALTAWANSILPDRR